MNMIKKVFSLFFLSITILFAQSKPYVILISFDGFRWDYPNRGLTPNIEIMKKEGVSALSFQPCFPSKTFPNHQSIITGMYIDNHGIISNRFFNPFTGESYRLGDTISTREAKWYLGEAFWETAERCGIKTASFYWPGSEIKTDYRHPTYFKHYNQSFPYYARVDTVVKWLKMPYAVRPHFITLYYSLTDTYGHRYGPNSKEINYAISRLDSVLGYLFDEVKEIGMKDSVNFILVSDHGMTEVDSSRVIDYEELLKGLDYRTEAGGPFLLIAPAKGEREKIYRRLKGNEKHYKVYLKENMPAYFHYGKHPFIPEIIMVADLGWEILSNKQIRRFKKRSIKGDHGYDNHQTDMHGIFFAMGPAFRKGYRTGTIFNVDVYPLLCKIFDIPPRSNVDGKLERISFILK
jgi:predicted AlkP superfamily pyrophosphatase or phosphodiesterase